MLRKLSIVIAMLGAAASQAFAEECIPYETVHVPPKLVCETKSANGQQDIFHDFSTNKCSYTEETYVQVPKPCPPKPEGRWVNVTTSSWEERLAKYPDSELGQWARFTVGTHDETCASVGMVKGDINGRICASGEAVPTEGDDREKIRYTHGRWGGDPAGHYVHLQYCYRNGQKRDHDGTDIVVAYYCKEP